MAHNLLFDFLLVPYRLGTTTKNKLFEQEETEETEQVTSVLSVASCSTPLGKSGVHTPVSRFCAKLYFDGSSRRVSTGGRMAACLSAMAFFALVAVGGSALADDNLRDWRESASPARLVFVRAMQERISLLAGPSTIDAASVVDAKAWSADIARPVRLVWSDATNAFFLVDVSGLPLQQEVFVYLLTNALPPLPDAFVCDPLPVRFYAQRTAGQDLPTSLEQMRILDTRVDRPPFYQALSDFEARDGLPTGWYCGDWQRKNHLVQLSSWLLFPSAGRYVFSLSTRQPVWLTVDDEPVLNSYDILRTGTNTSLARELSAGLHYVVARGVSQQNLRINVEWRMAGGATAAGVYPVTGAAKLRARWERRDRRLYALAVATIAPSYTFASVTNVFVPVTLTSRSVSRDGAPITCAWRLLQAGGGCELGVGSSCPIVLCAAPEDRNIELTVADNHGHTAQDIVPVTLDGLPRIRYEVSGRMVGVPAIGYEEDTVHPEIHVRATSPDDIAFTVEATIERANGSRTNVAGVVKISRSWGRLVLPVGAADTFNRISWRVLHAGVVLDRGSTVFECAPFQSLPDALDGDVLCLRTNRLMLVARRASTGQAPVFDGVRPGQRLLLLDGFLVVEGETNLGARLDIALGNARGRLPAGSMTDTAVTTEATLPDKAASARYQRINLRAMEGDCSPDGVARLLPLAQAGALLPADVVVVAPSFEALGQGETLAQFERRLATLVGLLAGPGRAVVVLVTPPPFAILPGCEGLAAVGVRPPEARQLAEMICRVADAYGLPVVDLYTRGMTAGEEAPMTRGSTLSAAGLEQALEALRLVLYGKR